MAAPPARRRGAREVHRRAPVRAHILPRPQLHGGLPRLGESRADNHGLMMMMMMMMLMGCCPEVVYDADI